MGTISTYSGPTILQTVVGIIDDVQSKADEAYATAAGLLEDLSSFNNDTGMNTDVTVRDVSEPDVTFEMPPIPVPPTFSDVPEPDFTFSYDESPYTSELKDLLVDTIYSEISNGSTGLTASVEADIYARESERDLLELQNTKDRMATLWAESGMSLPDGVLVSAMAAADLDYQNRYSDKSRDVRIESFKRADDNAQFVKALAHKVETTLMDYWGKFWDRKLEAAKQGLAYGQAIYETLIRYEELFLNRYDVETKAYAALADANSSLADAKTKKYGEDVKYVLGIGDIDMKSIEAKIELLKAQIAAAVSASSHIAQVASTLAAGAMSALNANASLSASYSESDQTVVSDSSSSSHSTIHQYIHSSD